MARFPESERGPDGRYHHLDLDLTGECLTDVTIRDVTFAGETRFDRCTFTGEVRFENCAFTGYVSFIGATAERLAFRDCRFGHIVNLGEAEFGELSVRRSEFDAPVELELGQATVDMHLTTFAGRSQLVGQPGSLELRRVVFRNGAQLRLDRTPIDLHDVEFGAPSALRPHDDGGTFLLGPRLLGVSGTDVSQLSISRTNLMSCTFSGAHNVSGFGVESLTGFSWAPRGPFTRRRVLWDEARIRVRTTVRPAQRWLAIAGPEDRDAPHDAGQVASDYRALRKAREDAKDEPGAADFYYGEMEMRRLSRRHAMWQAKPSWAMWLTAATEHTLLWLYWLISGYGLRAWRALTALVVVLVGAAVIFRYAGFPGAGHAFAGSLRFAVQSAMSLVRGTDEPLTPTGEWVALALRLLGPLLFGLALLALRGRVRR